MCWDSCKAGVRSHWIDECFVLSILNLYSGSSILKVLFAGTLSGLFVSLFNKDHFVILLKIYLLKLSFKSSVVCVSGCLVLSFNN